MDRLEQIVKIIEKNPGIKFSEIMKHTGMKNGVLAYHISRLEKDRIVKAERNPGISRFYPPNMSDGDMLLVKYLRQVTPR